MIDLTSQLEQIELHVAEWDAPESPTPDEASQTILLKLEQMGFIK